MGSQIPVEVMTVLSEFRDSLKNFNAAVKEFSNVPFEEMQSHPLISQAEVNYATMHATNTLAAINLHLKGKNPEDDDELQAEMKRCDRLKLKVEFARDLVLRPQINKFAANAFVRNALFDVTGTPLQNDWVDEKILDRITGNKQTDENFETGKSNEEEKMEH
uniref:Nuclear nucleic acid-binding protein C1D n=1 Tax=Panagrolaimus sp. JU765 TaxID=591449 RepID=A0AC34Q720_9BILA